MPVTRNQEFAAWPGPPTELLAAQSGLADQCSVQKVHGQTTEAQILVGTDCVADVSVRGVAFFVSETVSRHGKELHAILKIIVDMWGSSSPNIKFCLSKRFRSSFLAGQRPEPISNNLEALFDRLAIVPAVEQAATS